MTKRNAFLSVFGFFVAWMRKLSKTKDRSKVQGVSCPMSVAAVWLTMTKTRFSAFLDFCGLDAKSSRRRHDISGAGLS